MRAAAVVLGLLLAAGAVHAQGPALTEAQKIEALIQSVAELRGAAFIRNGSEYDAKAASDHLRTKRANAGGRVRTADDFIRLCGSTSSMTGRPYQIRHADGRVETSEAFLRARLAEIERK